MHLFRLPAALVLFIAASGTVSQHADFTWLCEQERVKNITIHPWLANVTEYQCGASFSKDSPPSLSIRIGYESCVAQMPGWQISKVEVLSQWIGPLVGFLLPSLVFTLVIPRRHRLPLPQREENFDRNIWISIGWLALAFINVVLDVLLWIILCFGSVGLLTVGAIDESLKDWYVLKSVQEDNLTARQKAYALAITLVGTFEPTNGDLRQKILQQISGDDRADGTVVVTPNDAYRKLKQLYAHQTSFGMQVGAPVVFYLGAYTYAIFDGDSKLGDNDTAHAIAFGLWYGVIVLAATCCCAVLGIGNPSTIESIFGSPSMPSGHPPDSKGRISRLTGSWLWSKATTYHRVGATQNVPSYKASWLWDRARCLREWTAPTTDGNYSKEIKIIATSRWIRFSACVIALGILGMICSLAMAISYLTPSKGFGCRSVTVFVYILCQTILVAIWFYHSSESRKRSMSLPLFIIGAICFGVSIFSAIGGTIMQLVGVYRNCLCKAGIRAHFHPYTEMVELATDTQEHRDGGGIWVKLGIAGICFIGLVSVVGWGYYMRMKEKLLKRINALIELEIPLHVMPTAPARSPEEVA